MELRTETSSMEILIKDELYESQILKAIFFFFLVKKKEKYYFKFCFWQNE